MESGEAGATELRSQERRIEPNNPYRIHGPTRIRVGSSQFLVIPDKRPANGGGWEQHLLLTSLDSNGNPTRVDGIPSTKWLKPGATIGRDESNSVNLPDDPLVSREHAKFTLGVEHQGEGVSNRIKNLLGRTVFGPRTGSWAITDIDSKNGTFVTKVDPRSLPKDL